MWRLRDFTKLRERSGVERQLLVAAILWLGVARAAILTIPFRWTTRLFALSPAGVDAATGQPSPELREVARHISWALSTAAARTPWHSTCLVQALAGAVILRCRRMPATIAMGVARSSVEQGSLEAHAWLSCHGIILTGEPGHEKYHVVARYGLGRTSMPPRPA